MHSVPRLMAGQGTIVGVGAMEYPAEYQGASQETLNRLGVSKILTLTSTYDHRIIQGAQSGQFLGIVHELLLGDEFWDGVFAALRIPYEPIRWAQDVDSSHDDDINKVARVQELIHAYRVRGHLMADTDPLEYHQRKHPDLDVTRHGLTLWDLDREFPTGGFGGTPFAKLRTILGVLRDSYCRTVGIEYMHIQDPEQREWIQARVERPHARTEAAEHLRILRRLNAAEAFETFLQTKYVGQKRFSLEGGETVVALLDAVLESAAHAGLDEVAIGMPHRGRLNVLANIVGKSYGQIFREFEGNIDPGSAHGSGDVKYHLGAEGTYTADDGEHHPGVAGRPTRRHLEAVDPVLEGFVRAKQDVLNLGERFPVLPVLMHGDAAFAGQGVVAETLELSQLKGYRTGGTVHIIVNNQVGFTTSPAASRSSTYATDVARTIQAPIFHVNGDDPEACVRVARLAFDFRQAFGKDVVIDMVCYRRRGHNEADDPSLTQPLMYKLIDSKRSVRKLYTEALIGRGDISVEEAEQALRDYQSQLEKVFQETRAATEDADGARRVRRGRPGAARGPGAARAAAPVRGRSDCDHPRDRRPRRRVPADDARGLQRPPAPRAAAASAAPRWWRRTASTSGWARRSRSARCSPRASRSGWPARTPGAAPSATGTSSSSTRRPAGSTSRSSSCTSTAASSTSTTPRSRSSLRWASSTATPSARPERARHVGGAVRRLRRTARRPSSTSSSPPASRSGASSPPSCCCCRTATRGRAPTTPPPGSSGSCSCARRTT